MKKVLILYNRVWPYRIPIFNLLSKEYDLTVSYSIDKDFKEEVDFKVTNLPGRQISRFFIHADNLHDYCKNFDVIIGIGDIGWLSLMRLLFLRKRNYKIILWGIGVRASYNSQYGEKSFWNNVRYYLMDKADAVLFYSENPIDIYLKQGFNREKLHVANNTVYVENTKPIQAKDSIIFIGTLYKQKRIYELLHSYLKAKKQTDKLPILNIIGGGDEYDNIKSWLSENNLTNDVYLLGKIFDEKTLSHYFNKSLACISPGQAGLSVLKSMGYGVPFITMQNAITGGEIFNIENNITGVLYERDEDLTGIILDIVENTPKYLEMGVKAKNYYNRYRKPKDMAQGIIDAIEYVSPTK